MALRKRLAWALMQALPAGERDRLARDFIDWLYADTPPAERRTKAERLAPKVIEWIGQSNAGLWLLLFQHLSRLCPTRAVASSGPAPAAEMKRIDARQAARPPGTKQQ